ncbi:uncharacterized protein LOC129231189 [Uloborus diversus]|uniref:uncharacterized protein LOC129231189 n=1 Tax=Uloborus diversus TaxID=327109 RepID=UPI00240A0D92|nr:uncharacterized protein LOC129231189 [Uloborus diversus]
MYKGVVKMAFGEGENKETEVLKKENESTGKEDSTSTAIPSNPEKSEKESIEKETTGSTKSENPVDPDDSLFSIFTDFLVILLLPIKPFYECLKSANPVCNKISQLFEETAVKVLKFVLTGSTWSSALVAVKKTLFSQSIRCA